jgi:succinate dehydrogenase / fumarate reductase flavoprotein subunit
MSIKGKRTVDEFHRELGTVMWDHVGMGRTKSGLETAIGAIRKIREEFWKNVSVVGSAADLNNDLERAGRVADFLELGELIAVDAQHRNESCGGHFRVEYQTEEGEAKRDDEEYAYVAAWEYTPSGAKLHKEPLSFEYVKPATRSYK